MNFKEGLIIFLSFILVFGCSGLQKSDKYPVVALPDEADLQSPVWKGIDLEPKPPVLAKTVEEERASFQMPPGYVIEPVLTEPQIKQPAAINFDANGRLLVLELRSYMLTADADRELEPINVISRWEDRNNDGIYETGGVFVDSLIFPRFVMPWGLNSVLTMESNQDDVYLYTDTDGDGKADKKEFFTSDFGRSGNVEHQQSFLYYGMDNWLYSTYNAFRIRWTPSGVIRENTGFNRAQWGVCQDNEGKIWFQGGASGLPSYFQFPIHYGNFKAEDELAEGFKVPWGAPMHLDDFQPGMQAVRQPDGSLNEVTGSAGNDIFRGHRLPAAMVGQYFYGEPVARIVRQINPVVTEGITQLHNQYQDFKREFIISTDPLFRPVDITTAPDGTLYITDMYHGIIQEGNWVQKGSYLRTKIDQFQMDKIVSLGRIWRVRYEGIERDTIRPKMGMETPAQLVTHLRHPNGWWRDMAQQELVHRRDSSVKGELEAMAKDQENKLARYHALWTLEGLNILELELVRELLSDKDPEIRKMALRVSETLYKAGEKSLTQNYLKMMSDPDYSVVMQAMMTANILKVDGWEKATKRAIAEYQQKGVQLVGEQVLKPEEKPGFFASSDFSEEEQKTIKRGATIYQELCSTCHGINGTGTPSGGGLMAPALANSLRVVDHPDYMVRVILRGLIGAIEGKTYTGAFMAPMHDEDNAWIASVVSYIRTNLGNDGTMVKEEEVAAIRAASEDDKPYTFESLSNLAVKQLTPNKEWNVTASNTGLARVGGTRSAYAALAYEGWTSGENQAKDMWFQIELPKTVNFSEIHFTSPPIRRGGSPDSPPPLQTYPTAYAIQVSQDGETWSSPVAQGSCDSRNTKIVFPPIPGRFIKITQTAEPAFEAPWKMESMKVFGSLAKESI
jgi:mono/diheme cytochrome c family protein